MRCPDCGAGRPQASRVRSTTCQLVGNSEVQPMAYEQRPTARFHSWLTNPCTCLNHCFTLQPNYEYDVHWYRSPPSCFCHPIQTTLASYPLLHPRSSHTDPEEAWYILMKPLSTWAPVPILPTIAEKCFLIIFCESSDMFGACNVSSLWPINLPAPSRP